MSVAALPALLTRRYGLRFDELTAARLHRALREDGDPDAAAAAAVADPERMRVLLDRITLQESSFFRDPPVYDDLETQVLPAAIAAAGGAPLTVWSLGCANGQEPWSLAMLLSELGVERFEVIASDLSAAAVARTREAVFHERELRGLSAARRARFLEPAAGGWRVRAGLRPRVRAVQASATDAAPVADGGCCLVLCRYVLIYLTPEAAAALLGKVAAGLRPDGRLVIGAAESLWHLSSRFAPDVLEHSVAYRWRDPASEPPSSPDVSSGRLPAHETSRRRPARRSRRTATTTRHAAVPANPTGGGAGGEPAGLGAPASAAELLRAGEVAAAAGDLPAAARAFRGAAYLDPDDALALVRLGLVLEAMADPGAQRAYRAAWTALGRRPPGALEEALGGFGAASLVRLVAGKLGEPA